VAHNILPNTFLFFTFYFSFFALNSFISHLV
jgi:hypothetical protein